VSFGGNDQASSCAVPRQRRALYPPPEGDRRPPEPPRDRPVGAPLWWAAPSEPSLDDQLCADPRRDRPPAALRRPGPRADARPRWPGPGARRDCRRPPRNLGRLRPIRHRVGHRDRCRARRAALPRRRGERGRRASGRPFRHGLRGRADRPVAPGARGAGTGARSSRSQSRRTAGRSPPPPGTARRGSGRYPGRTAGCSIRTAGR
jgi:hypothetical protein